MISSQSSNTHVYEMKGTSNRMSYNDVIAKGVQTPDAVKGFGFTPKPGDVIEGVELVLCIMRGECFNENANEFNKGCYWALASKVTRGSQKLEVDIPVATFVRAAGARLFPSQDEQVSKKDNLSSEDLLDSLLKKQKGSVAFFTKSLYKREASTEKLLSLVDKKISVVGEEKAYSKKFNAKDLPDWGSQASHWQPVKILMFEDITPAKKGKK